MDRVHFFTVELKNGHVMSTPRYEPAQEFVSSLVHEISLKEPEFAWVQFVFRNLDYHPALLSLKSGLSRYKEYADTPETRTNSEGEKQTVERKEKRTEWYRTVEEKMKKIDAIKPLPTLSMAIRGMWVGDPGMLVSLGPFKNCHDKLDGLAVVTLHDPRMLLWLVKRRMLADPAEYVWNYGTVARRASPELMLTTEELPYYVHLPAGEKAVDSLREALRFGATSTARKEEVGDEGVPIFREEDDEKEVAEGPRVASIAELPELDEALDEARAAELRHLSSDAIRSFEIVYDHRGREKKPATVLLSSRTSRDLVRFEEHLNSVYGRMDYAAEDPVPSYVRELATAVTGHLADSR